MNQSDQTLYNNLYKVKGELQDKFYDFTNGKRPSICSDNALRLLVKYKPTTLQDMENISGIGENFINNYGQFFLEEIKRFVAIDSVKITESENVILNKLENRLININKRNRLLYSSKINKDYGIDLCKYINNIDKLESIILSKSSQSFKVIDIENFDDDKLKSILKLIRQVSKIEVETGNNELYIAYPFVQGKMEQENFDIKAPLILFPVKLTRDSNKVLLKNDFSRDILYNTNLILANNKFNGKNKVLPDNTIENFDESTYILDMINFYSQNELYIQYKDCKLEKFLENKRSDFPKYKNGELEVKKYMVLGIYSTYVTSMYEDFHKMIKNSDITRLIKELLCGMEINDDNYDVQYNEPESKIKPLDMMENEINYINELDFSQEKVLREINKSDAIVIQGPPGTGKSQTITSIISQCILQGKNVLMVSEKKTALDVIYSRLGKLSQFAILIDDVENKQTFYEQLNSIIDKLNANYSMLYDMDTFKEQKIAEIKNKINTINTNIEHLETIDKKIYEINDFETTMYNIYNICKRFNLTNQKELEIYKIVNENITETLTELKFPTITAIKDRFNEESFSKSIEQYRMVSKQNPIVNDIKLNLIDIEIIELENKIRNLENFLTTFNNFPFYKKIFEKRKLKEMINEILDNYFIQKNKNIVKKLIDNLTNFKDFLPSYQDFISNKSLYNQLNYNEREYLEVLEKIKEEIQISFKEANNLLYNTILFNVICFFEKNNSDVIKYINDFESIRNTIKKNIVEKKELTKKLAFRELLYNCSNLNGNNKINKIEEMCNRKRKMAINKFMSKYKFEMLDAIKIWLMTPEVVSDIIPFEKNIFDLVIFDEASQLYVEKAIPAIYRAKKVIVAGDQKQLKPSNLGQGRILDEVDEDEITDGFLEYESLLDAARYKYNHTMLNYHYRSKYEELIAFSNYAFYSGKLMVTSLAQNTSKRPIERIMVKNGKWINKKNEAEAHQVVEVVKNILNKRKSDETIGVITFNASQMNLIEDLIEKEKMLDEKFARQMLTEENRFSNGENISFFVKNIESVQGDERDIIIFCIGYAKNEQGRVAINFGWLNQDGGENRLNVAISRAKQKIYIVTSIEPEELIVDYTKNDGPKLFKKYLEYAKAVSDGNLNLARSQLLSLLDRNQQEKNQSIFDSEFEEEVYNKLVELGYNVETQYGVGGYRIDLVIKSKDAQKNLLGIECDGRLYHSSKFARERDYHRQKYLESRGWKIYRIWSTNWWKNPNLEIKKIKNIIEKMSELKDNILR